MIAPRFATGPPLVDFRDSHSQRGSPPLEVPDHVHAKVGPAAPRVRPWSGRSTLGRGPPRSRRTRRRPAPAAGGRRTRDPVNAASRTTSPSGRPDDPPADTSPHPNSSPLSDATESDLSDFVNGLLKLKDAGRQPRRLAALLEA